MHSRISTSPFNFLDLECMKWFYIDESVTDGERRKGPYSIEEIREFVKQGQIKEETLVWRSGEENWKTWKDFVAEEIHDKAREDAEREELLQNTIKALEEAIESDKLKIRRFAGFFTRAVAFIVDNLILGIAGGIVLFILGSFGLVEIDAIQEAASNYVKNPMSNEAITQLVEAPGMATFLSIWTVIQTIYFIVFHAIFSATPGKMLVHIHVETHSGERLTWLSSIARYLCSVLTQFTMVFYGLGYIIVCIDPKRRALHDWIARTFVVYDEKIKIKESSEEEQEN